MIGWPDYHEVIAVEVNLWYDCRNYVWQAAAQVLQVETDFAGIDLLNKSLILTKTTNPTHPTTPPRTILCLNQVWSWSNLQESFISIDQDDI